MFTKQLQNGLDRLEVPQFHRGNYLREKTIQGKKLFKGENYTRKYSIQKNLKLKGNIPKDLPAWITGDLKNIDQDDYFVSEDESEKRILAILTIFSTILLMVSSILLVKCFNNLSFSVIIQVIHLNKGKQSDIF